MRIRLKNPRGHPRFDFGSKMTAFPSLRIRTSFPFKAKVPGKPDCLRSPGRKQLCSFHVATVDTE